MKHSDFQNKIENGFLTNFDSRDVTLILTHVDMLEPVFPKDYTGPKLDHYMEEPFRLTFRGPSQFVLPSQIHRLNGEDGTVYEIFLSAFLQNSDGIFYEAIFK